MGDVIGKTLRTPDGATLEIVGEGYLLHSGFERLILLVSQVVVGYLDSLPSAHGPRASVDTAPSRCRIVRTPPSCRAGCLTDVSIVQGAEPYRGVARVRTPAGRK